MKCFTNLLTYCVLGTRMSCAKTAEPIEMPFGGSLIWVHELDIGQDRTQPWGVTSQRCGLLPSYFGHLLCFLHGLL